MRWHYINGNQKIRFGIYIGCKKYIALKIKVLSIKFVRYNSKKGNIFIQNPKINKWLAQSNFSLTLRSNKSRGRESPRQLNNMIKYIYANVRPHGQRPQCAGLRPPWKQQVHAAASGHLSLLMKSCKTHPWRPNRFHTLSAVQNGGWCCCGLMSAAAPLCSAVYNDNDGHLTSAHANQHLDKIIIH
jgi:hypothetical protein